MCLVIRLYRVKVRDRVGVIGCGSYLTDMTIDTDIGRMPVRGSGSCAWRYIDG